MINSMDGLVVLKNLEGHRYLFHREPALVYGKITESLQVKPSAERNLSNVHMFAFACVQTKTHRKNK